MDPGKVEPTRMLILHYVRVDSCMGYWFRANDPLCKKKELIWPHIKWLPVI